MRIKLYKFGVLAANMEKISGYKILIVDDEANNIESLFQALQRQNYQILIASNGKIAIAIAEKEKPSAIVMDWDMPEMNGIEAIKELKKNNKTKDIPIIMATGKMTTVNNLETALECGANDYIRKPFDNIEVIARVKSMIQLNEEHKKVILLEKQIYKQKLQLVNEELENNSKMLTTTTLRLIQNSKINRKIIDKLVEIKKNTNKETTSHINKIISNYKIKNATLNWHEFELLFEKVHKAFYKRLNEKHPDLTQGERKLCAFIKLNMSNKDISAITFQQAETLKKARFRLKKKLKLSTETSMNKHIQSI